MLQLYLSELSEYLEGRGKVIVLCENARLHDTKPVTTYLTMLNVKFYPLRRSFLMKWISSDVVFASYTEDRK